MIDRTVTNDENWEKVDAHVFWRQMSHPDHVVQIYENDGDFIDNLVSFAIAGFRAGESVVVIATRDHISQLEDRLRNEGYLVFNLRLRDQFITIEASEALSEFMINGEPDTILFRLLTSTLMKRAKRSGRDVRAFGEMVALLWAQGNVTAALQLEHLWHEYMKDESFCLFCAYPHKGFSVSDSDQTVDEVCNAHTHHIALSADAGMLKFRRTGNGMSA